MKKPRIAITPRLVMDNHTNQSVINEYVDAVKKAGAIAYVLTIDLDNVEDIVNDFDGLLVTGGVDVSPCLYNEIAIASESNYHYACDTFDIALIKAFRKANKPILGICRGLQILNVAMGGSLYQDIDTYYQDLNALHRTNNVEGKLSHYVNIIEDSILYNITNKTELLVNSYHHQAIKQLANGFKVVATSSDGIIEAIETEGILALQWHPERLIDIEEHNNIFKYFINECNKEG